MDEISRPPSAPESRARRSSAVLHLILGTGALILLLGLLFSQDEFREAAVWTALARAPWVVGLIALAAAFLQTALSTLKWYGLMRRSAPALAERSGFVNLFRYTAMSNVLAQVLTPYLAGTVVRGWAMQKRHAGRFGEQSLLAGFEQLFDVVPLVVGGAIALLLIAFGGPTAWDVLFLWACLLTLPLATLVMPQWLRPIGLAVRLLAYSRWTMPLARRLQAGIDAGLDDPRLLGGMLLLSLARYAVLCVRTIALGALLLPTLPWQGAASGFSAVQVSALAALTPGNIGITEWSWAALAAVYPVIGAGALAAFALALRISGALASCVVLVMSLLLTRRVA